MSRRQAQNRDAAALSEYLRGFAVVVLCTVVALSLRTHLNTANLVMVYLIGVVAVAAKFRKRVAIVTSILSVAAFDFFCVPPYLTFVVAQYEYLVTFGVMLGVSLLISAMTDRVRRQAVDATAREEQTTALYRLSSSLAGRTRLFDIVKTAADLAEETFHFGTTIFLPDPSGRISFMRRTAEQLMVPSAEQSVAQWVFENGDEAGRNSRRFGSSTALYLPIKSDRQVFGVLAIAPNADSGDLPPEGRHLLEVFLSQTALAIERAIATSSAQAAEVRAETESLRTSLLSAVSHDLRTPLASITGAAATLRSHWEKLDAATRTELLGSVTEEAHRLNRLLDNLLEVTRLESGVRLHKERFPLEEIVGAALHRLRAQTAGRSVITDIPTLPMVAIDAVLMEQVFTNLVENAIKYAPEGGPVEIAARRVDRSVEIEVRDTGGGFTEGHEDLVFDKFFRGRTDNTRGAGLGLAICRAIVEAHGGSIHAANRAGGGAVIRFRLPIGDEAPEATISLEGEA